MPWSTRPGLTRTNSGPWPTVRRQALIRDGYQCTVLVDGARCTSPAVEVDHIVAHANGGTDTFDNAASICAEHHRAKTQAEAAAGRRKQAALGRRPAERHPGLI